MTATARSVIGIVPASAAAARALVLAALERVLPVRFEGREPTELAGVDGIVVFADDHIAGFHFAPPDLPCLVFAGTGEGTRGGRSGRVDLSPSDRLGEPLRGRTIEDELVDGSPPLELEPPDEILASSCGRPVWARRPSSEAPLYVCSVPPIDLAAGESLRDYFRPGQFISLLPLVHLLIEVTRDRTWTPPPLRASLIIDDPNLHWPTYGYVRFAELAHHARAHGYHAAMATIPLDLWYADPRAVRIFRESPAQLSLVVHGNDHTRSELAQPRPLADALDVVSHVLERIGSFERRTGLAIGRVMVPPHGDCNDTMFAALAMTGFDAVSWSVKPRSDISGWETAEFAPGGMPSLHRTLLGDWDDLPFRAYLRQPIVLEAHHTDLSEGLDVLERVSSEVNGLGDVTWTSPARIAETNYSVSRRESSLSVRMFSRRVVLAVPEGVNRISVETPAYAGQSEETVRVRRTGTTETWASASLSEAMQVEPGREIEIRLARPPGSPSQSDGPSVSLWPPIRRSLTESRDRVLPLAQDLKRLVGRAPE